MPTTNNASKSPKIRKPYGPLTQPSHLPIAVAEALQQAEAGSATCGHCANVAQTLRYLQAFADSLATTKLPKISGKDFFAEIN